MTELEQLAEWLYEEADKRMMQATSRRESVKKRDATAAELRQAKANAERMFGRKLDLVSTDPKTHQAYCDMQVRVADKLKSEAERLSDWAGWVLAAQLAVNTEHIALVGALNRPASSKQRFQGKGPGKD